MLDFKEQCSREMLIPQGKAGIHALLLFMLSLLQCKHVRKIRKTKADFANEKCIDALVSGHLIRHSEHTH
jgi:hypothetical protein